MSKPPIFRIKDFISFGIPSIVFTLLAAFVSFEVRDLQANLLMWTLAASGWLVYLIALLTRARFVGRISFIVAPGIYVITNDLPVDRKQFKNIVESTIIRWSEATKSKEVVEWLKDVYVVFDDKLLTSSHRPGLFYGYVIGKTAYVVFKTDLKKTALAHELGHIIHAAWTGTMNENSSHKFMKAHKLP